MNKCLKNMEKKNYREPVRVALEETYYYIIRFLFT